MLLRPREAGAKFFCRRLTTPGEPVTMPEMQLTIEQAAARLGKSPRQVRYLIQTRRLPARKFSGAWLIESADLELLRRAGAGAGAQAPPRRRSADLTTRDLPGIPGQPRRSPARPQGQAAAAAAPGGGREPGAGAAGARAAVVPWAVVHRRLTECCHSDNKKFSAPAARGYKQEEGKKTRLKAGGGGRAHSGSRSPGTGTRAGT